MLRSGRYHNVSIRSHITGAIPSKRRANSALVDWIPFVLARQKLQTGTNPGLYFLRLSGAYQRTNVKSKPSFTLPRHEVHNDGGRSYRDPIHSSQSPYLFLASHNVGGEFYAILSLTALRKPIIASVFGFSPTSFGKPPRTCPKNEASNLMAEVERYAAAGDVQALSKYPFVFVGDPYKKKTRNFTDYELPLAGNRSGPPAGSASRPTGDRLCWYRAAIMIGLLQIDSSRYRARASRWAVTPNSCNPRADTTKPPFCTSTLISVTWCSCDSSKAFASRNIPSSAMKL